MKVCALQVFSSCIYIYIHNCLNTVLTFLQDSVGDVVWKNVAITEQNGRRLMKFPLTNTWEDKKLGARKFQLGIHLFLALSIA